MREARNRWIDVGIYLVFKKTNTTGKESFQVLLAVTSFHWGKTAQLDHTTGQDLLDSCGQGQQLDLILLTIK